MKDTDIVIISVDRSDPEVVIVNTSVDLLHCPIRFSKEGLKQLGYTVFRPQKLKPIIYAAIYRQIERNHGRVPLGGFSVEIDDFEGLPYNPVATAAQED
ncbi:hypothetical protein TPY_2450 [Sulfobacillus acidophilus TPY]|uniref:Uncharacterized protein n=1 Tax=Sulfobacillus acidophilus (strain ATCC 700253 / DSM 10332 / NAL) TaxID=679936 RepID=G8TSF8_SULAD|nr:hypothetical protein TPY_2450 [Sulfobacillus acidophilus TPY]AEW06650.1 hypothetical protein Sulac_3204 [Sulfobacillus acidophilus DSM 10332]